MSLPPPAPQQEEDRAEPEIVNLSAPSIAAGSQA